jgi:UDP:flavonoid glycosyltransferase YjiC (YdhE family)
MIESRPRSAGRRRILFCAESVALSQVVRLLVLSRQLDRRAWEVHFASGAFDEVCFAGADVVRHTLPTVPASRVLRRVGWGLRPYGRATLRTYVESELALFERVRPDVIVGDFRLSLAVSAAVARVPQLTLVNAYWSPFAVRARWPVPDHPLIGVLGLATVERHFETALPWMFRHFAAPLNAVRREYGMGPVGGLLEMLSAGDVTLHPDVPELVATRDAPPSHVHLGPILWAPTRPLPASFRVHDPGPPWVYVTLGSSGDVRALPAVLAALTQLPVRVMVATAGRCAGGTSSRRVHVAPFLPGDEAARVAELVVCNGGSSTAYQALAEGTPVLGLPANLDQHLAMAAIERRGAGIAVRARGASIEAIRTAALTLLTSARHREAARQVARDFAAWDAPARFASVIDRLTSGEAARSNDSTSEAC